jgi:hypothetical protein
VHRIAAVLSSVALSGCTAHVFEPAYLASVEPSYRVEEKIVVLMHEHDQQYVFEGKPMSQLGEPITLTMPIGSILREVTANVFRSYFMYGVVFTDRLEPGLLYTLAIEPEVRDFSYRYDRRVEGDVLDLRRSEEGFAEEPVSIITPSIEFELDVAVHDASGNVLLEKSYFSGRVEGESYIVTSRPHERINATFHTTLQKLMLEVAEDVRPFLAQSEIG